MCTRLKACCARGGHHGPHAELAEVLTVIGRQHHHGVVEQTALFQALQQPPHLFGTATTMGADSAAPTCKIRIHQVFKRGSVSGHSR